MQYNYPGYIELFARNYLVTSNTTKNTSILIL